MRIIRADPNIIRYKFDDTQLRLLYGDVPSLIVDDAGVTDALCGPMGRVTTPEQEK